MPMLMVMVTMSMVIVGMLMVFDMLVVRAPFMSMRLNYTAWSITYIDMDHEASAELSK